MNTPVRRAGLALVAAALSSSAVAALPAHAAQGHQRPHHGDWTCTTGSVLTLAKGNKYTVDAGAKAKYVYKTGQHRLKFKNGDWSDLYYATYDRATVTFTLVNKADDTEAGTCTQAVAEPPAQTEPTDPSDPTDPTEPTDPAL